MMRFPTPDAAGALDKLLREANRERLARGAKAHTRRDKGRSSGSAAAERSGRTRRRTRGHPAPEPGTS